MHRIGLFVLISSLILAVSAPLAAGDSSPAEATNLQTLAEKVQARKGGVIVKTARKASAAKSRRVSRATALRHLYRQAAAEDYKACLASGLKPAEKDLVLSGIKRLRVAGERSAWDMRPAVRSEAGAPADACGCPSATETLGVDADGLCYCAEKESAPAAKAGRTFSSPMDKAIAKIAPAAKAAAHAATPAGRYRRALTYERLAEAATRPAFPPTPLGKDGKPDIARLATSAGLAKLAASLRAGTGAVYVLRPSSKAGFRSVKISRPAVLKRTYQMMAALDYRASLLAGLPPAQAKKVETSLWRLHNSVVRAAARPKGRKMASKSSRKGARFADDEGDGGGGGGEESSYQEPTPTYEPSPAYEEPSSSYAPPEPEPEPSYDPPPEPVEEPPVIVEPEPAPEPALENTFGGAADDPGSAFELPSAGDAPPASSETTPPQPEETPASPEEPAAPAAEDPLAGTAVADSGASDPSPDGSSAFPVDDRNEPKPDGSDDNHKEPNPGAPVDDRNEPNPGGSDDNRNEPNPGAPDANRNEPNPGGSDDNRNEPKPGAPVDDRNEPHPGPATENKNENTPPAAAENTNVNSNANSNEPANTNVNSNEPANTNVVPNGNANVNENSNSGANENANESTPAAPEGGVAPGNSNEEAGGAPVAQPGQSGDNGAGGNTCTFGICGSTGLTPEEKTGGGEDWGGSTGLPPSLPLLPFPGGGGALGPEDLAPVVVAPPEQTPPQAPTPVETPEPAPTPAPTPAPDGGTEPAPAVVYVPDETPVASPGDGICVATDVGIQTCRMEGGDVARKAGRKSAIARGGIQKALKICPAASKPVYSRKGGLAICAANVSRKAASAAGRNASRPLFARLASLDRTAAKVSVGLSARGETRAKKARLLAERAWLYESMAAAIGRGPARAAAPKAKKSSTPPFAPAPKPKSSKKASEEAPPPTPAPAPAPAPAEVPAPAEPPSAEPAPETPAPAPEDPMKTRERSLNDMEKDMRRQIQERGGRETPP